MARDLGNLTLSPGKPIADPPRRYGQIRPKERRRFVYQTPENFGRDDKAARKLCLMINRLAAKLRANRAVRSRDLRRFDALKAKYDREIKRRDERAVGIRRAP
jgi:hypothetical protein